MKRILLLSVLFLVFGVSFSQTKDSLSAEEKARREKNIQAGNPFKKFGYKPKIATLSKGKYLEFHDLDSIVKIGSFSYHVKNNQVTGYTRIDPNDSESGLSPEVISRWLSPDPLAEEFPSWSPYNYTFNNPVVWTDPTGLAPEWYSDSDGNIVYDENIKSQEDLDRAGIDGEYIAESLVGITESQGIYEFNKDGTINRSSQDAIKDGVSVIAIETVTGEMTQNTTPSKGGQFAMEAGAAIAVSQYDSPAPGPADVLALGLLLNAVKNLIIPQQVEEGYYNLEFAKSKKGKTSARQEEVQHGNQGTGKLTGSKKTKHQKRRPGDKGEKKRQKGNWKQY